MNMVIGYILTFLGCFGTVGTYLSIANDRRYTYRAPYTSHETTMIALLVISIIILIAGIFTIVFSVIKNRNEKKLSELTNLRDDKQIKNKCSNCGLNVSEDCTVCPKCGTKLK